MNDLYPVSRTQLSYEPIAAAVSLLVIPARGRRSLILRCRIDGLLLPARFVGDGQLELVDGEEAFVLESVEAIFYELVFAEPPDLRRAESRYRMLRRAPDLNGPFARAV